MTLRVSTRGQCVLVDVHVVPRAGKSAVLGEHDGCLKVALAAPPVDGAANRALVALLAELLARPRRDVTLVRGQASRRKTVAISGVDAGQLQALAGLR